MDDLIEEYEEEALELHETIMESVNKLLDTVAGYEDPEKRARCTTFVVFHMLSVLSAYAFDAAESKEDAKVLIDNALETGQMLSTLKNASDTGILGKKPDLKLVH